MGVLEDAAAKVRGKKHGKAGTAWRKGAPKKGGSTSRGGSGGKAKTQAERKKAYANQRNAGAETRANRKKARSDAKAAGYVKIGGKTGKYVKRGSAEHQAARTARAKKTMSTSKPKDPRNERRTTGSTRSRTVSERKVDKALREGQGKKRTVGARKVDKALREDQGKGAKAKKRTRKVARVAARRGVSRAKARGIVKRRRNTRGDT